VPSTRGEQLKHGTEQKEWEEERQASYDSSGVVAWGNRKTHKTSGGSKRNGQKWQGFGSERGEKSIAYPLHLKKIGILERGLTLPGVFKRLAINRRASGRKER